MTHDPGQEKETLRARAEKLLESKQVDRENLSPEEIQLLLHELAVHRIELEMQNDELREAQQKLELSRDEFADLYDFAPVGYVTLDDRGMILRINLTAAGMLGIERKRLVGQSLSRYVAMDSRWIFDKHLQECLFGGEDMRSEVTLTPRHADPLVVELHSARCRDGDQRLLCRTAITDISARKEAEDELRLMNATLEQLVSERTGLAERRAVQLQMLARRLAQVEHRERRRLAKLLHDHLQQMLVAARITTAMARRRSDSEELDHSLKQVDDLLNESISLSRSLTLDLCPPILHDVGFVAGLEWLARFVGERHQLDVEVDIAPDAELDDAEMRVILFEAARELLFNVVKHAHTSRARLIAERTADDQIRLTVSDAGQGFDPAKVDSGSAEGFGLFNIRQRLELMGGRLEVESGPGQGTRITILAPASAPSAPEDDLLTDSLLHPLISQRRRAASEEGATAAKTSRIRVLLADDHEIVREGLASLLLEEPDMEIVGEAKDGVEAVELAATTHPDVILMDVTMPRLDGIEATRQIKAQLPEVHVIGLSMHEEEDLARAMRQAGAAAYMSKNGCSDALVTAIRSEVTS